VASRWHLSMAGAGFCVSIAPGMSDDQDPAETREERQQMDELAAERPWSLRLERFVERAQEYGFKIRRLDLLDARGRRGHLVLTDDSGRRVPLPEVMGSELLDPDVTAWLCRQLGIPPEDFGLIPRD
jgi:hypothetical protein